MTKMSSVVHFEMPADDRDRMAKFYGKAFGWKTEMLGPEMGEYVLVTTTESDENGPKKPGAINGGFYLRMLNAVAGPVDNRPPWRGVRGAASAPGSLRSRSVDQVPHHPAGRPDWPAQHPSVVIAVDDIQKSIKKVTEAGGEVLGEPMRIPGVGLYVSFLDTEGNRVSMLQPDARMEVRPR